MSDSLTAAPKKMQQRIQLEELERAVTKRVRRSQEQRAPIIAAAIRHKKAMTGGGNAPDGDPGASPDLWERKELPLMGRFTKSLLSSFYYHKPRFNINTSEVASPAAKTRAHVMDEILAYKMRETDSLNQIKYMAYDAIPSGLSACIAEWDKSRHTSTIRWIPCSRLLIDADNADSPSVKDLRWVGEEYALDCETAEQNWPDHEFDKSFQRIEKGTTTTQFAGATITEGGSSASERAEVVSIVRIWVRGDNPETEEADLDAGLDDQVEPPAPADEDDKDETPETRFFTGKNELLYFEVVGGDKASALKFIERKPWEGIFDLDDFPITFFRPECSTDGFYPHSACDKLESLQNQVNDMRTLVDMQARVSTATKILVDPNVVTDNIQRQIADGDPLVFIKAPAATQASIRKLDLSEPSPVASQNAADNIQLFNEYSGINAMEVQSKSHTSATGDALKDKRIQLEIAPYADEFEDAVTDIARKLLQLDLSLMTPEDVARICGPEALQDPDVWPAQMPPSFIRREVDVEVEMHSMRYVSQEQLVQNKFALLDRQMGAFGQLAQMAMQYPRLAFALAKVANTTLKDVAHDLEISNPEDLLIPLDILSEALQPPPPPPQPQQDTLKESVGVSIKFETLAPAVQHAILARAGLEPQVPVNEITPGTPQLQHLPGLRGGTDVATPESPIPPQAVSAMRQAQSRVGS